jgi:hypothetical protein
VAIAILNAVILFALFPGFLPAGPFYNLIAVLSMLSGIYLGQRILTLNRPREEVQKASLESEARLITVSTAVGITLRVAFMSVVNYVALGQPYPFGYQYPEELVLGSLPLIAVFNATLALYTVPLGYSIANAIKSRLKLSE